MGCAKVDALNREYDRQISSRLEMESAADYVKLMRRNKAHVFISGLLHLKLNYAKERGNQGSCGEC